MKTAVKQFLADLYAIDPSLKSMETDIIPLLDMLLQRDPAQAPDAAFVARLRRQIAEKAAPSAVGWTKWLYAFGGAVAVAVILPAAMILTNQHPLSSGAPLFSNSVQATGKNAFGSLGGIASNPAPEAMSARPPSGGGIAPSVQQATGTFGYGPMDSKMIAPWPMMRYRYVFSGSLTNLASQVDVYKREQRRLTLGASEVLRSLNTEGINLASFDDMRVDSLSLVQHHQFGYQLSINLRDSSMSIDANWEQWPQSQCQTDACWQAERVKIGDVPADDVVLGIAEDFVRSHGIDVSQYGKPVVDNAWRSDYERSEDKVNAYVPETQRVVYPQLLDGKSVYDQSGQLTGMSISVHVKHRKVMNVYGLADRSYAKSSYEGVADASLIQKYLSKLDTGWADPAASAGAKDAEVVVTLGAPTYAYVVYYRYAQNVSEELLVPSLIFPVERTQGDDVHTWYYRTSVVVPLATDMLKEQQGYPMPLIMEKAAEVTPPSDAPSPTR